MRPFSEGPVRVARIWERSFQPPTCSAEAQSSPAVIDTEASHMALAKWRARRFLSNQQENVVKENSFLRCFARTELCFLDIIFASDCRKSCSPWTAVPNVRRRESGFSVVWRWRLE